MLKKIGIIIVLLSALVIFIYSSHADNIVGNNYRNVTVRTSVNITNSKPEVLSVRVYQENDISSSNITLNAGSLRNITCNASLRDWNGYNDITLVNATLWHIPTSNFSDPNNNNSHYTTNCIDSGNGVNYTVNYLCIFPVYYYANNGTWNCTVTVQDQYGKTGNNSNTTYVYPLYALNVTDGIDYGNVAVDDDSFTKQANITNFGNMPINISVQGYAIYPGDAVGMNCSDGTNVSIDSIKFSLISTIYDLKNSLNGNVQNTNLKIQKQINASTPINSTYWQIKPNPFLGSNSRYCGGFIIFNAEAG